MIIKEYFWFKSGNKINESDVMGLEIIGRELTFKNLNINTHNGNYSCSILLNNGQSISSSTFEMKILNCIFLIFLVFLRIFFKLKIV